MTGRAGVDEREGLGVVFFEETGEERHVLRRCHRCRFDTSRLASFPIVSPSGIAHEQHPFEHENTACGIPATGLDWWWRL